MPLCKVIPFASVIGITPDTVDCCAGLPIHPGITISERGGGAWVFVGVIVGVLVGVDVFVDVGVGPVGVKVGVGVVPVNSSGARIQVGSPLSTSVVLPSWPFTWDCPRSFAICPVPSSKRQYPARPFSLPCRCVYIYSWIWLAVRATFHIRISSRSPLNARGWIPETPFSDPMISDNVLPKLVVAARRLASSIPSI